MYVSRGTHHFNQSDIPFVAESMLDQMGVAKSELDATIANKINTDICWSFLRRYLLEGRLLAVPIFSILVDQPHIYPSGIL